MASHEHRHTPIEHEKPDSWHRHSAEEGTPMAEHAAIASPGALAKAYVVMFAVVVGTVMFLAMFFMSYMYQHRAAEQESTVLSLNFHKMQASVETEMNSYGWVDPQAGVVRIPIEKAMARVVEQYKHTSAAAGATK